MSTKAQTLNTHLNLIAKPGTASRTRANSALL